MNVYNVLCVFRRSQGFSYVWGDYQQYLVLLMMDFFNASWYICKFLIEPWSDSSIYFTCVVHCSLLQVSGFLNSKCALLLCSFCLLMLCILIMAMILMVHIQSINHISYVHYWLSETSITEKNHKFSCLHSYLHRSWRKCRPGKLQKQFLCWSIDMSSNRLVTPHVLLALVIPAPLWKCSCKYQLL
jgi:hypothetical protein